MSAKTCISANDFELFEESDSCGSAEKKICLKKEYGTAQINSTIVKKGLSYRVHNFVFSKDINILTPQNWDSHNTIWFDVCLAGSAVRIYKKRYLQVKPGRTDILVGGYDIGIKEKIKKNLPYKTVSVLFDFDTFFEITGRKPEDIFRLLSRGFPEKHIQSPIWRVAEQIAGEDFSEVDKKLFIEAKLLELVSYQLGQLKRQSEKTCIKKKKTLVERVYYAAEIIEKQMLEPPGIFDLSYAAGLDHNRLIQGFKDIFGVTPFEYLRKIRLKKAAELIATRKQNVTEAAFSVGYTNLSNFAKIFKREFGVSPSKYNKV